MLALLVAFVAIMLFLPTLIQARMKGWRETTLAGALRELSFFNPVAEGRSSSSPDTLHFGFVVFLWAVVSVVFGAGIGALVSLSGMALLPTNGNIAYLISGFVGALVAGRLASASIGRAQIAFGVVGGLSSALVVIALLFLHFDTSTFDVTRVISHLELAIVAGVLGGCWSRFGEVRPV